MLLQTPRLGSHREHYQGTRRRSVVWNRCDQVTETSCFEGKALGSDRLELSSCRYAFDRWFVCLAHFLACQGKGITDQDRNILSNQRLILDFLRSAPHCLTLGPIPVVHPARKRKQQEEDDDKEPQEDDTYGSDIDTAPASAGTGSGRGTVLITLRNVPPYSTWWVPFSVHFHS